MKKTKYMTVTEVAKILKVHKFSIYRWINNGTMKRIKIGKSVRITTEQLEEFIQLQNQKEPSE